MLVKGFLIAHTADESTYSTSCVEAHRTIMPFIDQRKAI